MSKKPRKTVVPKKYIPDEEILAAQAGDVAARNAIIVRTMPLARFLVRRVRPRSEAEAEDLQSESVFALMRAIDTYKLNAGTTFGTWAGWWIRARLTRQRWPKTAEGVASRRTVSLNKKLPDDQTEFIDLLEDNGPIPDEQLVEKSEQKILARLIATLPEHHQRVITLRFQGKTLEEIGDQLDVTRERVRQLLDMYIIPNLTQRARAFEDNDAVNTLVHLPRMQRRSRSQLRVAKSSPEVLCPAPRDRRDGEEESSQGEGARHDAA